MKLTEYSGKILSYPLGLFPLLISFLRGARTFHPQGILVTGKVIPHASAPIPLHPFALVRFSAALWKKQTSLPDVLGIAVRFSQHSSFTTLPEDSDQDLLFATIQHPLLTLLGPFFTNFRRFQKNSFYAVSPFIYKKRWMKFKMTLEHFKETDKDRNENLVENIGTDAFLRLWVKEKHKEWIEIADIRPKEINLLNQDELFFNPFRNGLHIRPSGFVHHLRYAVYPLSQFGRTLRHSLQEMLHQRDNRIIIERL